MRYSIDKKNSRRYGFTLVELMATTVLVAIILPAALKGLTAISGLTSSAAHRSIALNLAESKLNELIATDEWENGFQEGNFTDYKETISVSDYNLRETDLDLYRWTFTTGDNNDGITEATVTIYWIARGLEKELSLTTMVE